MSTIQDIADKMGISKRTLSKELNDAPDIREIYANKFWKLQLHWIIQNLDDIRIQ